MTAPLDLTRAEADVLAERSHPPPWVPVSERLPPEHQEVLVLIADPSVAIYAHPTVARLQVEFRGAPHERLDWWAGTPGQWVPIRPGSGWSVTHWCRLPEIDHGEWHNPIRAAAWERWDRAGVAP